MNAVETDGVSDIIHEGLAALRENLQACVLGCEEQAELLVVALLAHGHVLIEGMPGMGKTSLARVLAASLECDFNRLQFTPDLLPADILGYSIYDQGSGEFCFHPGPIFCNVLLADEINRTTPRIQSALLEAMNEGQVSIDGRTRVLEPPFFVIATRNHVHTTGTFPLPESQLDRFLLSLVIERPDESTQAAILRLHHGGDPLQKVSSVLHRDDLLQAQNLVQKVGVSQDLMAYIAALVEATHSCSEFASGVSARAGLALMRASQAAAFIAGRSAVYPDDIKRLLPWVFAHRLPLRNRVREAGPARRRLMKEILAAVPVP